MSSKSRDNSGDHDVLGINRRNLELVFADYRPGKFRILDDKLATKDILAEHGIPSPRTIAVIKHQNELADLPAILADLKDLVVKPAKGWGGRGILVLSHRDGVWVKPSGDTVGLTAIADHISDVLTGIYSLDEDLDQAILEERIFPHEFFSDIYPRGLADLRIVLDDGVPIQAMCRLPADASDGKANLHAGGVGLGVDIDTGLTTGAICKDCDIEFHPDTGAPLIGVQLPQWERCVELARLAAGTVDLEYLGVDIVVDLTRGPLILELNARPGLAIQLANKAAQPVAPRPGPSVIDRLTLRTTWVLLVLMVLLPVVFEFWQDRKDEVLWVDVTTDPPPTDTLDSASDVIRTDRLVTGEDELPLSETSDLFREARAASDRGDTTRSRTLYESALADSALAPFALNNLALMERRSGHLEIAAGLLRNALNRYPEYGRGYFNLGLILSDMDSTGMAISAYERALELLPSHAGAWASLGNARFRGQDFDRAETAYIQAIRFDPDARNARLRLGLTHRLQGKPAEAEGRFAELLALNPNSESAAYWWARTVRERNGDRPDQAMVSPDSVLTILAVNLQSETPSQRCRAEATHWLWSISDLSGALDLLRGLVEEGYRKTLHRREAAAVALDLGQWDLARRFLGNPRPNETPSTVRMREIVQLGQWSDNWNDTENGSEVLAGTHRAAEPTSDDLRFLHRAIAEGDPSGLGDLVRRIWPDTSPDWAQWLAGKHRTGTLDPGKIDQELRQLDSQRRSLDHRLEDPTDLPPSLIAWILLQTAISRHEEKLAQTLDGTLEAMTPEFRPRLLQALLRNLDEANTKETIRVGLTLRRIHPQDHETGLLLARAYLQNREPDRAKAQLLTLPMSLRRSTEARILLARIHLANDKPKNGLRELDRTLSQDPDHLEARIVRGEALFAQGKWRKGRSELEAVLNRVPERSDVRRLLARQLMQHKRYEEATAQWSRILRLGDATWSDRFNRALSLQRNHEYGECLIVYVELLAERPDHVSAIFNHSLALDKLGRQAEAQAGYLRVLEFDPEHRGSLAKLGLAGSTNQGDQ